MVRCNLCKGGGRFTDLDGRKRVCFDCDGTGQIDPRACDHEEESGTSLVVDGVCGRCRSEVEPEEEVAS